MYPRYKKIFISLRNTDIPQGDPRRSSPCRPNCTHNYMVITRALLQPWLHDNKTDEGLWKGQCRARLGSRVHRVRRIIVDVHRAGTGHGILVTASENSFLVSLPPPFLEVYKY